MTPQSLPLRSTQMILLVLVMGVLTFSGVVVFLRASGSMASNPVATDVLPLVLALVALAEVPAYLLVRKAHLARARADRSGSLEFLKQGQVPQSLHVLAIIGAAMAESVGLFGTVIVLIGGPWLVLAAPALAIVLILLQIPTRAKLERLVREA